MFQSVKRVVLMIALLQSKPREKEAANSNNLWLVNVL